jgi:hypothetical protein
MLYGDAVPHEWIIPLKIETMLAIQRLGGLILGSK